MNSKFRSSLVSCLASAVLLAGCSGDGNDRLSDNVVEGVAVASRIEGATVRAFKLENGAQTDELGVDTTDAEGVFSINVGSHSGPVLAVLNGGQYVDEATGNLIQVDEAGFVGGPLALRAASPGGTGIIRVNITPLTELAASMAEAEGFGPEAIMGANDRVEALFGESRFDILSTSPADVVTGDTATLEEQEYGLVLALLSQLQATGNQVGGASSTLGDVLADLRTELGETVDTLSPETAQSLNEALSAFLVTERNGSGLTEDDIQLDENLSVTSPDNSRPIARISGNLTATLGQSISLDASGSSDSDGTLVGLRWTLNSRPTGSLLQLQNETGNSLTFNPDLAGNYVVTLTVTDDGGSFDSVSARITIASANPDPDPNPGPDPGPDSDPNPNPSPDPDPGPAPNSAPVASNVSITDINGGGVYVGDSLIGSYDFSDADGDLEGATTLRWLRNGTAIAGETRNFYNLSDADVGTTITFEVTPAASTGVATGLPATSQGVEPAFRPVRVNGFARYLDTDFSGSVTPGDQLIVPFDGDVTINDPSNSDFVMPVVGDSLGDVLSATAGPGSKEITIDLSTNAKLKARQDFNVALTSANSASGIDVSSTITDSVIPGAVPSTPIDIVPGFVDTLQSLGVTGVDPRAVALGDLDGDGDLDMVIGDNSGDGRVFLNDGAGVFTPTVQSLGPLDSIQALALGDLDGDGDLDVFVGNLGPNPVFFNDGAGNFMPGQSLGSGSTRAVVIGDLDGDGDLDLVEGNFFGTPSRVYFNDGAGTFTDSGAGVGSGSTVALTLGDIDKDGDLDMIEGTGVGTANLVHTNDGSGSFTFELLGDPARSTAAVTLGDVDSDGDLDLIESNGNGDASQIYLNDGAGGLIEFAPLTVSGIANAAQLVDIDGDGDLDLIEGNGNGTNVLFNRGNGDFRDSGQVLSRANAIAIGDVDGDGDLDITTAITDGTSVYKNSLTGARGDQSLDFSLDTGSTLDTRAVALGDVDGDGDLDIVEGNDGGPNRVLFNDTGAIVDSAQGLGNGDTWAVALGDLDGDGDLDLVEGNSFALSRIWFNDGSGGYSDSGFTLGGTNNQQTRSVALGDLNRDGCLDIVMGNDSSTFSSKNKIFINSCDGTGNILPPTDLPGAADLTRGIALGDVDRDGDLDIVVGNRSQANRVFLNDGQGAFTEQAQSGLPATKTTQIILVDLDKDGDLDLVEGNDSPDTIQIYRNDGAGTFSFADLTESVGSAGIVTAIAVGDMDGDGDPDLIRGIFSSGSANEVYFNDGLGGFGNPQTVTGFNVNTLAMMLGDLDNDGDLDLVDVGSQENGIFVTK